MSSAEFTRWIAWYRIRDGADTKRDPMPEELGEKIAAWAAQMGSRERS